MAEKKFKVRAAIYGGKLEIYAVGFHKTSDGVPEIRRFVAPPMSIYNSSFYVSTAPWVDAEEHDTVEVTGPEHRAVVLACGEKFSRSQQWQDHWMDLMLEMFRSKEIE